MVKCRARFSRKYYFKEPTANIIKRRIGAQKGMTAESSSTTRLTAAQEQEIRERVSFDIVLRQVKGNYSSFSDISFAGVPMGGRIEWVVELCVALEANTQCRRLSLADAHVTDGCLQKLVIALASASCAPQLATLDLRSNPISFVGETMAQGLRKLRPGLHVLLGKLDGPPTAEIDGFACDKMLVEGLTAWDPGPLKLSDGDLRCPTEIAGEAEVVLKKGFSGSNGTKYSCELAEFEMGHATGSLVLKRLCKAASALEGTLV